MILFVCCFDLGLVFFLGESFENAVELCCAALECGNHILGGRLEERHNVGDKFVLALDGSESVELVGTDVNSFLNVCTFKSEIGRASCRERVLRLV